MVLKHGPRILQNGPHLNLALQLIEIIISRTYVSLPQPHHEVVGAVSEAICPKSCNLIQSLKHLELRLNDVGGKLCVRTEMTDDAYACAISDIVERVQVGFALDFFEEAGQRL